ncbi:hypothetical protein ACS0TY_002394 [Phlomoides rotata]
MGDFNEILWSNEKKGGNTRNTSQMGEFRGVITILKLQDIGFQGNKYTWSNGRASPKNIQSRLDRALATSQ